jgi:hypothetical protein
MVTYHQNELHGAPDQSDVLRMMLRQSIHDLAIIHDARRESFERLSHICILLLPAVVFVVIFGSLHHGDNILYGCFETVRDQIVDGNPQLILEMFDGRLVRFRRDVSVPTTFRLLCASCDWLVIPTPGLGLVCTRTNACRAPLSGTW